MNKPTALVTGAAKRIGAAIARELHRMDMDVVVHFNASEDDAKSLIDELNRLRPASAHPARADLGNDNACESLIGETLAVNGRLDVLINNAAVFYPTPLDDLERSQWSEIINVNLKAPLFLSKYAAPFLAESRGCIINLADVHALLPLKRYPVYSISKAGLVMLTKSLARELGPFVRVNAIAPGAILWPEDVAEPARQKILARTVLKKTGGVDDVCNAVRYLIRDAKYTTGEVLVLDGGRTLY